MGKVTMKFRVLSCVLAAALCFGGLIGCSGSSGETSLADTGSVEQSDEAAKAAEEAKRAEEEALAKVEADRKAAEEAAAKLKDVIVTVRAKAGANGRLFGSVTSQEIVDALREQHGVSIEKNRIVQAEPIKSFGSFEVKCKFGYGIDGTVQLLVIEK